jgi:hypothetical protein
MPWFDKEGGVTRGRLASVAVIVTAIVSLSGCSKSASVGQEFTDGPLKITVASSGCIVIGTDSSCVVRLELANRTSTDTSFSTDWQQGKLANGQNARLLTPLELIVPVGAKRVPALLNFAVGDSTLKSVRVRGAQGSKGVTVTLSK